MSDVQEVVPVPTWEPVGVVRVLSFANVLDFLRSHVPTRALPNVKLIEKHGLGQHKFRHFRSYTCQVEQPLAGKRRGTEVQKGRDGRVTLTLTSGPVARSTLFSYTLPREYSEGGE